MISCLSAALEGGLLDCLIRGPLWIKLRNADTGLCCPEWTEADVNVELAVRGVARIVVPVSRTARTHHPLDTRRSAPRRLVFPNDDELPTLGSQRPHHRGQRLDAT